MVMPGGCDKTPGASGASEPGPAEIMALASERERAQTALRELLRELAAGDEQRLNVLKVGICRLGQVNTITDLATAQIEYAYLLLQALKPSPPGKDAFTEWATEVRRALEGQPPETIAACLNAAARAIELYEAHERLAAALYVFNAAMPKGAPKIAQGTRPTL